MVQGKGVQGIAKVLEAGATVIASFGSCNSQGSGSKGALDSLPGSIVHLHGRDNSLGLRLLEPLISESTHLFQDGHERGALVQQAILYARRHFSIALASNNALCFELRQTLGKRAGIDLKRLLQSREASGPFGQITNDQQHPLATDQSCGLCYGTSIQMYANRLLAHA